MLPPRPLKHETGNLLRKEDRRACRDAREAPGQLHGAPVCLFGRCIKLLFLKGEDWAPARHWRQEAESGLDDGWNGGETT